MKSSIEKRKFLNPALTFALASSVERAHRLRDGSMQIRTDLTARLALLLTAVALLLLIACGSHS